ncbi:hypothetical protein J8I26_04370 [Herbaspirillum sp. LeCh32-8]|uniref:hypothetical protein n=1 Tax=Herbaspirillum sp. LeCh32-8 TaxID=2821356 RepID=UPI001AE7A579|nr:hypothetical protein [Herbaspirillum sp. LeCh32-8]MBP0597326.1 hypothetical protein [Herbaspirillum sp. LeCh32-8]
MTCSLLYGAHGENGLKRPFSLIKWPALANAIATRTATLDQHHDDISGQEVKQLLLDLMRHCGQETATRPALELQLGEIVTRTSVEPAGADLYLCVTATLPPADAPAAAAALLSLPAALDKVAAGSCDFLWHADEGRYVLVRKVPLRLLTDERSVMDEILVTADLATECAREIIGAAP